jgi:hypothetical protein
MNHLIIHSDISNHATLIVEKPVGRVGPHQGTPDICGAANQMSQTGSKPQGKLSKETMKQKNKEARM